MSTEPSTKRRKLSILENLTIAPSLTAPLFAGCKFPFAEDPQFTNLPSFEIEIPPAVSTENLLNADISHFPIDVDKKVAECITSNPETPDDLELLREYPLPRGKRKLTTQKLRRRLELFHLLRQSKMCTALHLMNESASDDFHCTIKNEYIFEYADGREVPRNGLMTLRAFSVK